MTSTRTPLLRSLPAALALTLALGAASSAQAQRGAAAPIACADFHANTNAAWVAANPLPPGVPALGRLSQLNLTALEQQRQLLIAAAASPADEEQRLLGTFWTSGMDAAAIEADGLQAVQPLLARIDGMRRPRDLATTLAALHAAGVPVLFNVGADVDLRDFSKTIGYLTQGGLGLPDPAYYTREDADTRALLARYRSHVEQVLAASGVPQAQLQQQSGWITSIEMQLAAASQDLVALRDPTGVYRPTEVRALDRAYPALRLRDFLEAQGVEADSMSLGQTAFFEAANRLLRERPVEEWKAYLRFHVLNALSPFLGQSFQAPYWSTYQQLLQGRDQPPPREVWVVTATNQALGDLLGREYAQRHVTDEQRARAAEVIANVRGELREALGRVSWLQPATREAALAKLERLSIEVGQPEEPLPVDGLAFTPTSFAGNALAAAGWRHRREMAAIGRATAPGRRWPTPLQVPDLSYDIDENRLVVTAAMLQSPVFDPASGAAAQYGALGALAGHELSHAFDESGRQFDAEGRLQAWWTPEDVGAYARLQEAMASFAGGFEVAPGLRVNGTQTRAENLADLAGLELAWAAFNREQPAATQADKQAFFRAWASLWARTTTDEELRLRLATDIHAPARFRANGPLQNFAPFAEAFGCRIGGMMQRPAEQRITIWN